MRPPSPSPGNFNLSDVVFSPTAGGNAVSIPCPFTHKHYTQEDKSLNKLLWEPFLTESMGVIPHKFEDQTLKECREGTQYTAKGEYVLKSLERIIPKHEKGRILANLSTLSTATSNIGGAPFIANPSSLANFPEMPMNLHIELWGDLNRRKKNSWVEPLPTVVKAASRHKDAGNEFFKRGQWIDAVREYTLGLFKLYPGACTPIIFSSEDAFTYGIAPLEGALWCNMSAAAFKLESDKSGFLGDLKLWARLALFSAEAVINMRYATFGQLAKAYARASVAGKIVHPDQPIGSLPSIPPAQLDSLGETNVVKLLIASKLVPTIEGVKDNWAHANCVTKHDGCGCDEEITPSWRGNTRVYKTVSTGRDVLAFCGQMA